MSLLPPDVRITRLANAYQLSRAVQVAARLDLGRHLAEGPQAADQLARATATDTEVLSRLLRFLAELEVVAELEDGRFASTPLSDHLDLADNLVQGEDAWAAWDALPEALRHGRPVFADVHGASFWDHAAAHPERQGRWQRRNAQLAGSLGDVLAEDPGLDHVVTFVDVGGGDGTLLARFLVHRKELQGVLVDLPSAVARAPMVLGRAGVMERSTIVAGDARRHVPAAGELYLLCRVLFNLDDQEAARILAACRRALDRNGRLWILEPLMPELGDPARRALAAADLHHFLLWGGKHRTRGEMTTLLAAADFELGEIRHIGGGWPLVEARPS